MNPASSFSPRQTINGLLIQMHGAGFDQAALKQVVGVHALATAMFNGMHRGTGKPFLCHLVGTASAVAEYDGRLDMILAGLLHAVFDAGVFPDGRAGRPSPRHRQWLTRRVGPQIVDLLERYQRFGFAASDLQRLLSHDVRWDRDMILLRLCNELDDISDGGLAFAAKRGSSPLESSLDCERLAVGLGVPMLGARIVELARESDTMAWAASLSRGEASYRVAPGLRDYLRLRRKRLRGVKVEMLDDH